MNFQQSGGFSGLFAYAVSFANGRLAGWQVLFILEGLLTIALGAAVYFILPDWPHVSSARWFCSNRPGTGDLTFYEPLLLSQTSKWMSPLEQEYVVAHLHRNAPKKTSKTWSTPEIVAMFADPTFWLFSLFWACEFGLTHPPDRAWHELMKNRRYRLRCRSMGHLDGPPFRGEGPRNHRLGWNTTPPDPSRRNRSGDVPHLGIPHSEAQNFSFRGNLGQ